MGRQVIKVEAIILVLSGLMSLLGFGRELVNLLFQFLPIGFYIGDTGILSIGLLLVGIIHYRYDPFDEEFAYEEV